MDQLQSKISGTVGPASNRVPTVNAPLQAPSSARNLPSEAVGGNTSGQIGLPSTQTPAPTPDQKPPAPNPKQEAASLNSAAQKGNDTEIDLALAENYLAGNSSEDQKAQGLQLLWLATEKGSTEAELELAGVYTEGVAVPRNCVQARILLKAASAANPAAAESKLRQLDQQNCN